MRYELTVKFNKKSVAKDFMNATDRPDLDAQIGQHRFWKKHKDRLTIKECVLK